ncbi:MAG: hypothetical protein LBJ67_09970 [Planctomycetaceae bacterium]|nr:hypothetical protein [Planctomycetaceae bacterium]
MLFALLVKTPLGTIGLFLLAILLHVLSNDLEILVRENLLTSSLNLHT